MNIGSGQKPPGTIKQHFLIFAELEGGVVGGGGGGANEGEQSEGAGGTFGRLPLLLASPPPESHGTAPTERHITSKRRAKERRCRLV